MKFVRRIAFLLLMSACALPVATAENSRIFVLEVDVRVGDLAIPQGRYEVSWTAPAGFQVQLTLTASGKKPITIPARLISERHLKAGVTTFEENGVTYLQDFHTTDETFIIPGTPSARN